MASLVLLTGCGGPAPDSADQTGAGTGTSAAETEPTGTAAPDEGAEGAEGVAEGQNEAPEEPAALDEEQKMQLLLSTEDLPVRPEGHSTHSGVSYFQESIAVEYTQYQDTFGQTECAQAMDQINVNLVGEDPLDGLAHAYRLPAVERDGQEHSPQVYVWVLSYGQEVDTSGIWEVIHEHCSGTQLEAGDEYVEIESLDLEKDQRLDLEGISMVIHSGDEPTGTAAAVRHSMSVDFGENLVMLSAVGLDTEEFGELADIQADKLTQFQDSLAEDAG